MSWSSARTTWISDRSEREGAAGRRDVEGSAQTSQRVRNRPGLLRKRVKQQEARPAEGGAGRVTVRRPRRRNPSLPGAWRAKDLHRQDHRRQQTDPLQLPRHSRADARALGCISTGISLAPWSERSGERRRRCGPSTAATLGGSSRRVRGGHYVAGRIRRGGDSEGCGSRAADGRWSQRLRRAPDGSTMTMASTPPAWTVGAIRGGRDKRHPTMGRT